MEIESSRAEVREAVAGLNGSTSSMKEIASFLKTLCIFIVLALLLRASVVEAFRIPSGSMIPTLRIGDQILVSKLSYGIRLPFMVGFVHRYAAPQRGDIVVFTRPDDPSTPDDESSINIIKRIIGLPGDEVEVRNASVIVNGQLYTEPYARWDEGGLKEGNFGPETVPEDYVFLLGDNRDHSKDSRFWEYPFLEIDRIKGRALFVYWSWDSWKRVGNLVR